MRVFRLRWRNVRDDGGRVDDRAGIAPVVTLSELMRIMPYANSRAAVFLPCLNDAMEEYAINTPARQAAFLAQIAHESGSLRYVREIASGSAYEGRADLGNRRKGDGVKFRGRGLIQITGRANYQACSMALFGDDRLIKDPVLLEQPYNASRSAAWFWYSRNLNALADDGKFVTITKRINGGRNGLEERQAYYARAKEVLTA